LLILLGVNFLKASLHRSTQAHDNSVARTSKRLHHGAPQHHRNGSMDNMKNSNTRWLKAGCAVGVCLSLMACSTQDQARVSQAYAAPATQCDAMWSEIQQLNAVLGADLDQPANDANPTLLERGVDATKDSAIKAVGRTTESVVPFRSWVRKLSGAEKHDREVQASITAGAVRRAFLKGAWLARDCR
jgi:hypothetical protein